MSNKPKIKAMIGVNKEKAKEVEFIVNPQLKRIIIPQELAERLGLEKLRKVFVKLNFEDVEEAYLSIAYIKILDREFFLPVIIVEKDIKPSLGEYALELFKLKYDEQFSKIRDKIRIKDRRTLNETDLILLNYWIFPGSEEITKILYQNYSNLEELIYSLSEKLLTMISQDDFLEFYPGMNEYERKKQALRYLSILDRDKLRRIATKQFYLEQLLNATLYGLGERFYRDHFFHSLRVMLLAHALALVSGLNYDDVLACTLAGLVHDLAYPLTYAREVLTNIAKYLKETWKSIIVDINRIENAIKYNIDDTFMYAVSRLLENEKIDYRNHAILSALEFYHFWNYKYMDKKQREIVYKVLKAVILHDAKIATKPISFSKDPVSFIVALSDELQEWERPIGSKVCLENLNLKITKHEIVVSIDLDQDAETTPLMPFLFVANKQKSLKRFIFDGNFLRLKICFKLPQPILSIKVLDFLHDLDILKRLFDILYFEIFEGIIELIPPEYRKYYLFEELSNFSQHIPDSWFIHFSEYNEIIITETHKVPEIICGTTLSNGKLSWDYHLSIVNINQHARLQASPISLDLIKEYLSKGYLLIGDQYGYFLNEFELEKIMESPEKYENAAKIFHFIEGILYAAGIVKELSQYRSLLDEELLRAYKVSDKTKKINELRKIMYEELNIFKNYNLLKVLTDFIKKRGVVLKGEEIKYKD